MKGGQGMRIALECCSEVVQMSRDSHRQTGVLEEMWAGDEAV